MKCEFYSNQSICNFHHGNKVCEGWGKICIYRNIKGSISLIFIFVKLESLAVVAANIWFLLLYLTWKWREVDFDVGHVGNVLAIFGVVTTTASTCPMFSVRLRPPRILPLRCRTLPGSHDLPVVVLPWHCHCHIVSARLSIFLPFTSL